MKIPTVSSASAPGIRPALLLHLSVGMLGIVTAFHHHHAHPSLGTTDPSRTTASRLRSQPSIVFWMPAQTTGPSHESRSSSNALFMSDIPQDDDQKKKKKRSGGDRNRRNDENDLLRRRGRSPSSDRGWNLPPAPEDQFVLIGDLLSLAVYGISDHLVCQTVSRSMVPIDHARVVSDVVAAADAPWHAPVWWEAGTPQAVSVLQTTLESHLVTRYSPLLEPVGQATVLLTATWLLAGWFHRAFLFRNTLECSTEKALEVTARTWLTTCCLLFGLVVTTQAIMGVEHWATNFPKGDVDYIVDSLTVLIVWRFMASQLLGGGSK